MDKGSQGPARMSRSAGGKPSHLGRDYAAHAAGGSISGTPISATNGAKDIVNCKPSKTSSRMGKSRPVAQIDDRWGKRTKNPSGAPNTIPS